MESSEDTAERHLVMDQTAKESVKGGSAFLNAASGEMAELIRAHDWASTALGPIESWPPALKMMVKVALASRFPKGLWWGPDYISIYNDAYAAISGARHPWMLGRPCREAAAEVWHVLKPLLDTPFQGGPTAWVEDLELEADYRGSGFLEEMHFTLDCCAVPDDSAPHGVGGVLVTANDITARIIGPRRIAALGALSARSAEAKSAQEACAIAADTLARYPKDVPFVLLYLIDPAGRTAHLVAARGLSCEPLPACQAIALDEPAAAAWPLTQAACEDTVRVVDDIGVRLGHVPPGPWSVPPQNAIIVPLRTSHAHQPAGFLVAGLSIRLHLDEQYRSFFELAASHIATAISNARAYEEERKRAAALAELDRAKTVFFSNVSHELRTPLTLILGPLHECAADPGTPHAVRSQLELAHRNALRLLKLVNTLLDFSRIEADRMQACYAPVDLAAHTRDLASTFRSAIERAGLALHVECPQLGEPVYVDQEMWEKIVLNLLSNAFKFTFSGTITVSLRREGSCAVLEVADTGVGVPANELPRLFERFHRVAGTAGRTQEGTGIGLALVQDLVKLHGGTIRVESGHGSGTRFFVTLPFGSAHLPAERIRAPQMLAAATIGASTYVEEALRWLGNTDAPVKDAPAAGVPLSRGVRVLLADDNADMRDYVRDLLSPPHSIEAVADGLAALEAARREVPDLILADVMMPRLDGIQLLKALRADILLRDVPVVLLSARAGEESRIEGLDAGADDYLVKPFHSRELLARVSAQIGLKRMRRASERRFRALVSATSDIIFQMSPDFSALLVLNANEHPQQYMEPDPGWFEKYVVPEDREHVMSVVREAIRTKSPYQAEHRVPRANGRRGWISSRAVPILDDAGNVTEWFGAGTDVTARKEAEQILREREEALRLAHAELRSGMSELARFAQTAVDRESRMIELKEEVNELRMRLGLSPKYSPLPMPEGARRAMPQEDPEPQVLAPLSAILRTDELRARPSRPADHAAEVRALTALMQALAAAPRLILNTLVDTALAELRAGSAGVSLPTPDGKRMYSPVIAGEWSQHADKSKAYRSGPCGLVIESKTSQVFAHWERRHPDLADITPLAQEVLVVPFCIGGKVVGTLWVASHDAARRFDPEDLRLLESLGTFASAAYQSMEFLKVLDQRHAVMNLLEDAVQARQQAESANQKLQQSEEALREAARRKDEFLALLGHELRNPMSPITSASELLPRVCGDDPRARAAIDIIKRQMAQLTRLVDDLLDVGRITQGRIQLDMHALDLASVTAHALETVEPLMHQKQHNVLFTSSSEPLYVRGDLARLVQCVVNILTNACKYSEACSEIRMRTHATSTEAILEVCDDGAGISAELLPKVFDIFVQGERTLDRAQGGLGIGLSLTRRLIEMHGGQISAASGGLGRGATFEIRLPRAQAPEDARQSSWLKSPPRRVLIVDDNADSARALSLLLTQGGHETEVALSARQALACIERFSPEVALLDIGLPEVDGYELARRLRAIPQLADTRLVALTGYGQTEDRERAFAAGFDGHLVKPVDFAVLERTLAGPGAKPGAEAQLHESPAP